MSQTSKPETRTESNDPDRAKGAVEQDRPEQPTNTDFLRGQNEHRHKPHTTGLDPDTDFPEPGNTPEYSMQKEDRNQPKNTSVEPESNKNLRPGNDPDGNAAAELNDNDPGERQKENQNQKKDDDLAA